MSWDGIFPFKKQEVASKKYRGKTGTLGLFKDWDIEGRYVIAFREHRHWKYRYVGEVYDKREFEGFCLRWAEN